jgi:hypothetical protein
MGTSSDVRARVVPHLRAEMGRESRAHLGGKHQIAALRVVAHESRFECGAAWLDAPDQEILTWAEFDFDSIVRSRAWPIARLDALGDDALQAEAPPVTLAYGDGRLARRPPVTPANRRLSLLCFA